MPASDAGADVLARDPDDDVAEQAETAAPKRSPVSGVPVDAGRSCDPAGGAVEPPGPRRPAGPSSVTAPASRAEPMSSFGTPTSTLSTAGRQHGAEVVAGLRGAGDPRVAWLIVLDGGGLQRAAAGVTVNWVSEPAPRHGARAVVRRPDPQGRAASPEASRWRPGPSRTGPPAWRRRRARDGPRYAPRPGAAQDVDPARPVEGAGSTDDHLVAAVAVEVGQRDGRTEPVTALGLGVPGSLLGQEHAGPARQPELHAPRRGPSPGSPTTRSASPSPSTSPATGISVWQVASRRWPAGGGAAGGQGPTQGSGQQDSAERPAHGRAPRRRGSRVVSRTVGPARGRGQALRRIRRPRSERTRGRRGPR